MKINQNITNAIKANNKISFGGYNIKKNDYGENEYNFNYPHDSKRFDCYVELNRAERDGFGNYKAGQALKNLDTNETSIKLGENGAKVNLALDYDLAEKEGFTYRYKLIDKYNNNNVFYKNDPGLKVGGNYGQYNVVTRSGSTVSKGGAMILALPDSYNVGVVYDKDGNPVVDKKLQAKAQKSVKMFSNKLGGTLAGIEAKLPELKKMGITRVVGTPIFTDDSLSSHSYWNKNNMQTSRSLGNINNYASLQRKMFKAGMNFVSDGAFVNEGLEGIHFKNLLKWGEKSPYKNWFKADGIQSGTLKMGVFPRNAENVSHKVVNSPYNYEQKANGQVEISKNKNYKAEEPTYIQVFDKRLVSDEQLNDTKNLITSYDKLRTDNEMEISTHDDTIVPYSFEIQPETYNDNIKRLNEHNKSADEKISLGSYEGTRILSKFENFELENKFEGGFETWDANTDIAKLNFVTSHADNKKLKNLSSDERKELKDELHAKNCEVQDYIVTSGKYWTGKTSDILTEFAAQQIGKTKDATEAYSKIQKLVKNGDLPDKIKENVTLDVVQNVISDDYELKRNQVSGDYDDLTTKSVMDLPLDSIEFGDDVVAALGSDFVSKRAREEEQIGVSRFELFQAENPHITPDNEEVYTNTDEMFARELKNFTQEILANVNKGAKSDEKIFEGDNLTEYGKYVVPLVAQDIAKFAIVKALAPQVEAKVTDNGEMTYDYDAMKKVSVRNALGYEATSPEDEANELVTKIRKNVVKLSKEDKNLITKSIEKRLENTDVNSFKLAEMLVDRTNAGLDWRIDATKDVADMDAIRNGNNNFTQQWEEVVDFWQRFTNGVVEKNPDAYFAAEVTDEGALFDNSNDERYQGSARGAVNKLIQEAGFTTTANYSHFFTSLQETFGRNFEDGHDASEGGRANMINDKLKDYVGSAPLESLVYSYTFVGNHDKPRVLHCLALDMNLFHSKFDSMEDKKVATSVLKNKFYGEVTADDVNSVDFRHVNNKAIAMGQTLKAGFGKALGEVFNDDGKKDKAYAAIGNAIADMADGRYLDKEFAADGFGSKPFDVNIEAVIKQAEAKHGLKLSDNEKEKLFDKTFEKTVTPAMTKVEGMMNFLVALPGNATLFSGDNLGLSGYEEKTKNVYLQNRSVNHWEWLSDKNKQFVQDFNKKINDTMELRSRPELEALNDGTPYVMAPQYAGDKMIAGIARQRGNGEMAISLFNTNNMDINNENAASQCAVVLDSISLHEKDGFGFGAGLKEGTTFKNADKRDTNVYKVCEDKGAYFIKRFASEGAYNDFLRGGKHYSDDNKIDMFDRTLILHTVPQKKQVAFTGHVNFSCSTNMAADAYKTVAMAK